VDDFIDAQRCVSNTAACRPANQNARIHGMDLSGSFLALQYRDYGDFTVSAGDGFMADGEIIFLIAPNPVNARLKLDFPSLRCTRIDQKAVAHLHGFDSLTGKGLAVRARPCPRKKLPGGEALPVAAHPIASPR